MFLSILISVLLQFRGEESTVSENQSTISQAESLEIESRLERLQSDHVGMAATIAALEKLLVGEDQTEILELQARLVNIEKTRAQALKRQIELSQHLSETESQVRKLRKELEEIDQKLSRARSSLAEKSKAIDEALDAREQKTNLPIVKTTSKSNLLFLMRYGKLYMVSSPSGIGYYSEHIIEKEFLGVTRIKPRANEGWRMTSSSDVAEFEGQVAASPPDRTFFSCAVWPDSYEQFGSFKQTLIRLGYDYELIPIDDVEDVPIGRGGSSKVQ